MYQERNLVSFHGLAMVRGLSENLSQKGERFFHVVLVVVAKGEHKNGVSVRFLSPHYVRCQLGGFCEPKTNREQLEELQKYSLL